MTHIDELTSTTPVPKAPRPRFQLSATQVVASALAAVTATIALSFLGVSGTVIGAAVASVITVTGNAVYSHSIRRTSARVRTVVPISVRHIPADSHEADLIPTSTGPSPRPRHRIPGWQRAGIAALAVFAALLAAVTSVELVAGRPISDLLRGKPGSGTTLGGTSGGHGSAPASTPAPATKVIIETVTPSFVTITPTVTETAPTVTATATPSPSPSPTVSTPEPTGSTSPSGTATP